MLSTMEGFCPQARPIPRSPMPWGHERFNSSISAPAAYGKKLTWVKISFRTTPFSLSTHKRTYIYIYYYCSYYYYYHYHTHIYIHIYTQLSLSLPSFFSRSYFTRLLHTLSLIPTLSFPISIFLPKQYLIFRTTAREASSCQSSFMKPAMILAITTLVGKSCFSSLMDCSQ